jgi:carboxypeptidase C (cathepsin A)
LKRTSSKTAQTGNKECCPTNVKRSKIILIGDSHARGYAANISNYLGKDFEITGTVMSGARLENIIELNTKEIRTLGKNDAVIVCGGSNDSNKNEASVGLRQLKKFVSVTQDTNILIVTAPHRRDLQVSSCVNKEIEVFNRKSRKMMKTNSNVSVVHTNLSRSDFTLHGMHMNVSGKEKMVVLLGQNIKAFMVKHKESPIILKWEEAQIDLNQGEVKKNLVTGK